jgi:formamidopyrimidine-DNA glycosylase
MPELPEAERARREIERTLGRRIVAVDDRDTYVCRPHAPGEIADALTGRRLVRVHRRGKFMWAETDGDGPELGLHLGMAGRIAVDDEPHPRWDRFVLEFEGGGRLALRDRRRLGRALVAPDFAHVGPDAAEATREEFRERVGRGRAPVKADRDQNRAIREWAQAKGLDVSDRGRIKQEIIDRYNAEAGR